MHGELQLSTRRKHMASRYPSGQTKGKHDKRDDRVVLWRRIKDHAVRMGADPDMGSVIGRLSLAGILTDSESAAAIWAAETIGRYERLQGYPRRASPSPAYERSYARSSNAGESTPEHERRVNKARRAKERLEKTILRVSLGDLAQANAARSILEDVCCGDIEPSSLHHKSLAALLKAIAKERGI
jgi:hypothetical protein